MQCQAVLATTETNSFLVCCLEWKEDGAKRRDQERTLGWWRQWLGEQSNEITNQEKGSSGKRRWPMENSGDPNRKPRSDLGLLTVPRRPWRP